MTLRQEKDDMQIFNIQSMQKSKWGRQEYSEWQTQKYSINQAQTHNPHIQKNCSQTMLK